MGYSSQLAALCAINLLLAVAAYLPLTSGCLLLCVGAAMGAGAIADGLFCIGTGMHPLVGLLAAGAAGGGLMLVVALLFRGLSGFTLTLGSVGVAEFARAGVEMSPTLGGPLGFAIETPELQPLFAMTIAAITLGLVVLFERSLLRKGLSLSVQDPRAAASLGFDLANVRVALMVASGVVGGVAGSLYIRNIGLLDPMTIGFEGGLLVATFAVVGGRRTLWGAVATALALTLLPEWLRFNSANRSALYGGLLVVAILIRFSPIDRVRLGRRRDWNPT